MRKLPLVLALFIQFTITDLIASSIILQPKNILDVDDGTLYESQILIEDGIIVEIGKNIGTFIFWKCSAKSPRHFTVTVYKIH